MHPAIRAIPTFGIFRGVTTAIRGINHSAENIPVSPMAGMIQAGGIYPPGPSAEEG
jgi:hypothetical protein